MDQIVGTSGALDLNNILGPNNTQNPNYTALLPQNRGQWQDPVLLAALDSFTSWYLNNPGSTVLPAEALGYIRLLAPRGIESIDLYTVLIAIRQPPAGGYANLRIEVLARQQIAILHAMIAEAQAHL